MATYQHKVIEDVVDRALRKNKTVPDDHCYAPLVWELKQETTRLIHHLPGLIQENSNFSNLYVIGRYHQLNLQEHMDKLLKAPFVEEHQHLKQSNHVTNRIDWVKEMYECLEQLLLSWQAYFAPYLTTGAMIPDSYFEGATDNLKTDVELLKAKAVSAGIDPELLNQLIATGDNDDNFPYNHFNYIRRWGDNHLPDKFAKLLKFKLLVGGTVYDLGYILYLLLETNCFLNKNKKQVASFFAFFCSTVDAEHLSPDSLKRKFSTPPARTVKFVRQCLKMMMLLTEKHLPAPPERVPF